MLLYRPIGTTRLRDPYYPFEGQKTELSCPDTVRVFEDKRSNVAPSPNFTPKNDMFGMHFPFQKHMRVFVTPWKWGLSLKKILENSPFTCCSMN
ncbi:hypothetical protein Trydic_g19111 [Trypoxylus dichotomus]